MPVTFQVVGNLADFGNDPRPNVKVRATASPGVKIGDVAIHSNEPETVLTDETGAFTLELVSIPGVWYRIQTPYGGALPTVNLAGYVPDEVDPTTGTAFPADTVIDVKDVANENPHPGYQAVLVGPVGPQGATGPAGSAGPTGPAGTTDYNALANKPTLGTAAATAATAYATSAQGTKADTAVQPAALAPLLDSRFMSDIGDTWDGASVAAAVAAERGRIEALFKAASNGTQVAIGRRGNDYDLWQQLGTNTWWRISLAWDATAGGQHHSLWQSVVGTLTVSLDQGDASWVYTVPGAGWATSTQALTFGGTYTRNDSVGATATWTTPAGATAVGIRGFRTTNGGYAKASVDGSATAANRLPTAQDEVTAGRLASTALVANGGTLNPTDRLFDSYNANSTLGVDEFLMVADGLTAGVHTVALVHTGYKQTASTGTRLYISGGFYVAAANTPATAGASLMPLVTLLNSSSVYEYAVSFTPAGGSTFPFIGNRHGNEIEDTFTIKLNGSTVTPADGSVTLGTTVEVTRTTHLRHPDTGATNVANGVCVYTMTPAGGLEVHWRLDWLVAGLDRTSYVGMLPTQSNVFAKGRAANGPVVTLLSDDGSVKGSTRSDTVALWQDGGQGAAMMTMRNLPVAVNRWAGAPTDFAWLQDRATGDFNKGYMQRVQAASTEAVSVGTVYEAYLRYRSVWMTSTATI